jgi:hypothetical protein
MAKVKASILAPSASTFIPPLSDTHVSFPPCNSLISEAPESMFYLFEAKSSIHDILVA